MLTDGQRIQAVEATRNGDVVEIQLATGDLLSYPSSSVASIELSADAVPTAPPPPISGPVLPYTPPPPAGENKPISGPALTFPKPPDGAPRPISGPVINAPTVAQQQAVFTSPYQPRAPIIDPTWQPTNAFDPNADVLAGSRTQWSKPIIDPTWTPTQRLRPECRRDGRQPHPVEQADHRLVVAADQWLFAVTGRGRAADSARRRPENQGESACVPAA